MFLVLLLSDENFGRVRFFSLRFLVTGSGMSIGFLVMLLKLFDFINLKSIFKKRSFYGIR